MKLKEVKVFETEYIDEKLWEDVVQYMFEGREDTTTYIVWGGLENNEPFERNELDNHLITECGCQEGEKIIIERGSW